MQGDDPKSKAALALAKRVTVKNPTGINYPGIYDNPREIAAKAAARVAPESPALRRLFGVTRGEMYEQGAHRKGNMEPTLTGIKGGNRVSESAERVMTPRNERRILDTLTEAQKHEGLRHGMMPWYFMDPAFHRLKELRGHDEAVRLYNRMNHLTGMSSPGSEVPTELNRGLAANYLAEHGRFDEFMKHAGKGVDKRGEDFPPDISTVSGHPYHSTSQAPGMKRYLDTGDMSFMKSVKVPTYIPASGVPETGFQTTLPVPDAHFTRFLGMADTRGGEDTSASMFPPEYKHVAPWFKKKIASKAGMESAPAQALMWGAGSHATGVTTPIGSPKLEMLADHIMEVAHRHGISPEEARDKVLQGHIYADGGYVEGDDDDRSHFAAGGAPPRPQAGGLPHGGGVRGGEGLLPPPGEALGPAPLQGLPRRVKVPMTGGVIDAGPDERVRRVAESYMASRGVPYRPPSTYAKVDPNRAQRIAQAYEDMKHDPEHPDVRAAYQAMIDETKAQYDHAKAHGFKAEFWDPHTEEDPYAASPRLAVEDIRNNHHMFVYPTEDGFGNEDDNPHKGNPLLGDSGERWNGKKVTHNDIFRAMHDYFGHAKEGVGFRADGEENAWRSHAAMYSPLARKAATTETRGQNSWLNYGPHGEHNKGARTEDTVFAPQKIGILPDWVHTEGAEDFGRPERANGGRLRPFFPPGHFAREENLAKHMQGSVTPPVLYHGTTVWHDHPEVGLGDIHEFDRHASVNRVKRKPSFDTVGHFFDESPSSEHGAGMYSGNAGAIYPAHVRITNPWRPSTFEEFVKAARPDPEAFRSDLLSRGHDGIVFPPGAVDSRKQGRVWVAMHPEQIKSATGNRGTFDPAERDITKASGGAVNHEPTEGQKHAGNYKKEHVILHGLDISIENKRGSSRSGLDPDGKRWSVTMPADYGYIKRTRGADGDHVDVYVGPDKSSTHAFIINQHDHKSGDFDEHKVMLGYRSEREALSDYHKAFSDGRGPDRVGSLQSMSIDALKHWLKNGNTEKPARHDIVHKALGIAASARKR